MRPIDYKELQSHPQSKEKVQRPCAKDNDPKSNLKVTPYNRKSGYGPISWRRIVGSTWLFSWCLKADKDNDVQK